MKPNDAIKKYIPVLKQKDFSRNARVSQPILGNVIVWYLYEPEELEGGIKRATDLILADLFAVLWTLQDIPRYIKFDHSMRLSTIQTIVTDIVNPCEKCIVVA